MITEAGMGSQKRNVVLEEEKVNGRMECELARLEDGRKKQMTNGIMTRVI